MARPIRLLEMVLCAALLRALCLQAAIADERIAIGQLGVSASLPEGWTAKIEQRVSVDGKPDFNAELKATCETERCRKSQETCRIWVYDQVISGLGEADAFAALYNTASKQYDLTRTMLMRSGQGARVAKPVSAVAFGQSRWMSMETRASGAFKSVLFARTRIQGRDIMIDCRTCEHDEPRFDAARAIIGSVVVD